jgi:hypothetical protein
MQVREYYNIVQKEQLQRIKSNVLTCLKNNSKIEIYLKQKSLDFKKDFIAKLMLLHSHHISILLQKKKAVSQYAYKILRKAMQGMQL